MSLKRNREDVAPSDAAALEQPEAKKPKVDKIYIVTHITYLDDYKARGDSWADESPPRAFRNREAADKYVFDKETAYLRESIQERWAGNEDFAKYFKDKTFSDPENDELDEEAVMRDRNELLQKATRGEFVPETVSWTVHTVSLQD